VSAKFGTHSGQEIHDVQVRRGVGNFTIPKLEDAEISNFSVSHSFLRSFFSLLTNVLYILPASRNTKRISNISAILTLLTPNLNKAYHSFSHGSVALSVPSGPHHNFEGIFEPSNSNI
jgi:hypothetical protein